MVEVLPWAYGPSRESLLEWLAWLYEDMYYTDPYPNARNWYLDYNAFAFALKNVDTETLAMMEKTLFTLSPILSNVPLPVTGSLINSRKMIMFLDKYREIHKDKLSMYINFYADESKIINCFSSRIKLNLTAGSSASLNFLDLML